MFEKNPIAKWFVGIVLGLLIGLILSGCTIYKYESPTVYPSSSCPTPSEYASLQKCV